MGTAACGINCDVCNLKTSCGGCVSGIDPKAPERSLELKEMLGALCPALDCAVKRGQDYCLRCSDFPSCKRLYKWEIPYSRVLLNLLKDFKEKKVH